MTVLVAVLAAVAGAAVVAPATVAARRIADVHRMVPDTRPLPSVPVTITVEAQNGGEGR